MSKKNLNKEKIDLKIASIQTGIKFLADGKSGFSLRDIAREIGVSHGAPGKHFGNKEGLLAAIAEEGFKKFNVYLENGFIPDKPKETFFSMGHSYVNFALENPQHYSLMFGDDIVDRSEYEGLSRESEKAFGHLVNMIQWLQREQIIKNGPTLPLAFTVLSSMHGLVSLQIHGILQNSSKHLPMEKFDSIDDVMPMLVDTVSSSLLNGMNT